jgi:LIM homeobox protein 2/9
MKNYFNLNHNPDAKDLKQLAQKTCLTKRVLQVWFQNGENHSRLVKYIVILARAKWRRSQHGNQDAESSAYNVYALCNEV